MEDLSNTIITAGRSYLENLRQIEAAKAAQKISAAQAQALVDQAKAQAELAAAQSAADAAAFKKKLPLYIGGGIAALALLYFVSRRR